MEASPPVTAAGVEPVAAAVATRVPLAIDTTAGQSQTIRRESRTSESSSDDGYRMSPAAARRFARRNLRRTSPTPDLVTSLVRPPSPDPFYAVGQRRQNDFAPNDRPALGRIRPVPSGDRTTNAGLGGRRSGPLMPPHPSSLDIPKRYGGECIFDMYSLTYDTDPDPNLLCPICHDPLIDPVTTPCDHTFCYRCLRRSIDSSPSGTACPIDRDDLSWSDCFSAARLIRTQLNSLVVKCPHRSRGCNRQMRRDLIESHATNECRFRDYHCPDAKCDKRVQQKPADNKCLHHDINCKYCDETIQEANKEYHLVSCLKSKTRCESCWQMVVRSGMTAHHEYDCDGIEVGCTYQDLGCPVRMERGHLAEHLAACAFHPETASGIIIRSQREVIQSYNDLTAEMQEMRNRQDEAAHTLANLLERRGAGGGSDGLISDNRTMQDLDAGFEEVHQNLTHLEARQSMWTMNQVMPIREEVTELRNNINMIRMHVNWLLNRSREEGRIRAANNSGGASATIRRESAGDMTAMLPERRRSSGSDVDLPRL